MPEDFSSPDQLQKAYQILSQYTGYSVQEVEGGVLVLQDDVAEA